MFTLTKLFRIKLVVNIFEFKEKLFTKNIIIMFMRGFN